MVSDLILKHPDVEILEFIPGQRSSSPEKNTQPFDDEVRFDLGKLNDSNFKKMLLGYDKVSGSPIEHLVTSLIASLSGAVGKNAFFQINDWITLYLNVYALIIGPSSLIKKTTSIDLVTLDLHKIVAGKDKVFEAQLSQYRLSHKKESENFDENEPRRECILLPHDSTVESLTMDILPYTTKGLFVIQEVGGFFAQFEKSYASNAKPFYTAVYDVPITLEISRRKEGTRLIKRPFISMIGASTTDWIKKYCSKSDLRSGFLPRFMVAIRNTNDKPYKALLELKNLNDISSPFYFNSLEIFEFLTSLKGDNLLEFSKTAAVLLTKYDKENYERDRELAQLGNEEVPFFSRLSIYAYKFAGIIALTNKRFEVSFSDAEDACYLTDFFRKNAEQLVHSEMKKTEFSIKCDSVLSCLKKKGKLSRAELLRFTHLNLEEIVPVLDSLVVNGLIEKINEGKSANHKDKVTYSLME